MKKVLSIFLLLTSFVLTLSACGADKLNIENYEWKMRYVVHTEDNQVVHDAVAEEVSAFFDVKVIDMTLVAKDGKITVTDVTNNKTYTGTYKKIKANPKSINYEVTIDGKDGFATVAMTTYADGTEEPTLPINLGEYSIDFYAE